ncbi:MAG: 30S ribosomal protein S21 [Legionellales bacterium]|jgi:small subunit ribosomal protein S21|nr:30S ribosomal protein S21 [Legionellales bacterium]
MPDIDVNKCKGHLDTALRRLKRMCDKLGVARRWREIEHHEKRTAKKRRQMAAAIKRQQKKNSMEQIPGKKRR